MIRSPVKHNFLARSKCWENLQCKISVIIASLSLFHWSNTKPLILIAPKELLSCGIWSSHNGFNSFFVSKHCLRMLVRLFTAIELLLLICNRTSKEITEFMVLTHHSTKKEYISRTHVRQCPWMDWFSRL